MNCKRVIGIVFALGVVCTGVGAAPLQTKTIPQTASKAAAQKGTANSRSGTGRKMEANGKPKPESEKLSGAKNNFDVHAYRNRKRVLILFALSADDSRFVRQQKMFASSGTGFTEHDLVRIEVFETGQSRVGKEAISVDAASRLRAKYGPKASAFRAVLIGKDGHIAYSTARPISAANLFGLIDAMPMRREEMRRKATER